MEIKWALIALVISAKVVDLATVLAIREVEIVLLALDLVETVGLKTISREMATKTLGTKATMATTEASEATLSSTTLASISKI